MKTNRTNITVTTAVTATAPTTGVGRPDLCSGNLFLRC